MSTRLRFLVLFLCVLFVGFTSGAQAQATANMTAAMRTDAASPDIPPALRGAKSRWLSAVGALIIALGLLRITAGGAD